MPLVMHSCCSDLIIVLILSQPIAQKECYSSNTVTCQASHPLYAHIQLNQPDTPHIFVYIILPLSIVTYKFLVPNSDYFFRLGNFFRHLINLS